MKGPKVSNIRTYALAASTVLLGSLACLGLLHLGHLDDAPGLGMIGFATLLASLFIAYRILRSRPLKP